ncbi:bifunctional 2-polyprenyl-6-hydroxyphenol methylase/3-demethylubiquinol 3-O-methyltransferase UbiG [Microbulbifer sp. TYP-18]|uniref:bifunctional 2-polyprenyl-6-hydroxyphenol methylase/3-demethylubiquinol 3-O-methyltransferase UbiG n=1 Tax=Microbulbifer sp. TYP-18 TaxID=3230024 RepID=UPI0034C694F2
MSNVDPAEIAKFEQLASRWWDRHGEFKPLHDINPLRANYIDQRAKVLDKKLLDVGCGGGILAEAMTQRGAQVTGIDLAEAPLKVAELHALESGLSIDYRRIAVDELAEQEAGSYDVVTCLEMLEHVPDPAAIIRACARLVKPGGDLFFSTINRNAKSWLLAIVGVEYVLRMLPKGTHEYSKFIRPSELGGWLREADLTLHDICGMTYNPITRNYKLNPRDVDVNYLVYATNPQ